MSYIIIFIVPILLTVFVVYYFVAKKNSSKKKAAFIGCLSYFVSFACILVLVSLVEVLKGTGSNDEKGKNSSVLATDSYNNGIVENKTQIINVDSIIDANSSDVSFKKDEFDENGRTWVHSKDEPRYRNRNAYYCYFQINKDKSVSNFRFVIQYEADDWLFIRDCVFNIDGENIRFTPTKMARDNASGRIWEWCDESVSGETENLIRKIASAKTVKVKLNGDKYYDTRTIKIQEIASIKKMLSFYEELGGNFY